MSRDRHRRPSGWARLAVASALALIAAGCTVPSDGEARPLDPSRLETTSTSKRNCNAPSVNEQNETVTIFLVNQRDELPFVSPVNRYVADGTLTVYAALDALFNCIVTQDDKSNGLATLIPDETQLLGVVDARIPDRPGLFTVQLGPLQNSGGQKVADLDKLAVAQIFFTATAPRLAEQVTGLRFVVDGRGVAVNTDNGTVSQTDWVNRTDFKASSPPTTTTAPVGPIVTSSSATTTR